MTRAIRKTWGLLLALVLALVLALAVSLGLAAAMSAPTAAAQSDDLAQTLADILDFDNYYIGPDAEQEVAEFEALIDRAASTGDNWYFVSLGVEPDGGPSALAGQIASWLPDSGTVVVINEFVENGETRFDVGINSADYEDDALDAGLDIAGDTLAGQSGQASDVAAAVFDGVAVQPKAAGASDGSGVSAAWLLVPVGGLALVGGGVATKRYFDRRKDEARDEEDIEKARAEIKAQADEVANYVISQADYVELSTNETAKQHYAEATATYSEVTDALPRATTLLELAELNDKIDEARWQMQAAEALIDGQEVPPKPTPDSPVGCFFDPTHRPGTERVTITTAAGDKQVRVCVDDAEKLKRGERPEPRMIDVHGRRVPAAKAPRSHGGLGMGGIDIFDVILGGAGRSNRGTRRRGQPTGTNWDWTFGKPSRPRPRNGGGVFGPDRVPRANRGSGRRRDSGSTSTRPRRSSRPKRRTSGQRSSRGRARRRF